MAQWWDHSPPTNVTRIRFPDPPSYVGCSSLFVIIRVLRVSSGFSGFPTSTKTNTPNCNSIFARALYNELIALFCYLGKHLHFWFLTCFRKERPIFLTWIRLDYTKKICYHVVFLIFDIQHFQKFIHFTTEDSYNNHGELMIFPSNFCCTSILRAYFLISQCKR